MRSPVRPLPANVGRWASRARWLRWLDALAAWLLVWAGLALWQRTLTPAATAIAAAVLVGLAALGGPGRRRGGPPGALIALSVSRALRPGDRAWLVLPRHVEPVIVTARRRLRLVVARPDQGAGGLEGGRPPVLVRPP